MLLHLLVLFVIDKMGDFVKRKEESIVMMLSPDEYSKEVLDDSV